MKCIYYRLAAGVLGCLCLSGCSIHMSAQERVDIYKTAKSEKETVISGSIKESREGESCNPDPVCTSEAISTEENTEEPLETAALQEYEEEMLSRLHVSYLPLSEDTIKAALQNMGCTNISDHSVFSADGGTSFMIQDHENANYFDYFDMICSAAFRDPEVFSYNVNDGFVKRSAVYEYYNQKSGYGDKSLISQAEEKVCSFLEEIGYTIGYMDCCYLSSELLLQMKEMQQEIYKEIYPDMPEAGIEEWERDGILCISARQLLGDVLIENYTYESVIEIAYSLSTQSIVYAKACIPPLKNEIIEKAEAELMNREDAMLFGETLLESKMSAPFELKDVELVYAHAAIGSFDYESCSASIWPAWKVSYSVKVGEKEILDYIMLDAETGDQLTNATSLY